MHRSGVRQRGIVLLIALVVMTSLALAAAALMQTTETTTRVVGNLAWREVAIMGAAHGIESAAGALFADVAPGARAAIADPFADLDDESYVATYDPAGDDRRGIPRELQERQNYPLGFRPPWVDGAGNEIRYVIQRLCRPPGPADLRELARRCDVAPSASANGFADPAASPLPYYRVTVRVDGPAGSNTVQFVQAMLMPVAPPSIASPPAAAASAQHRLSWRVVGD